MDSLTRGEMKCMHCVINGRNGGRVFIYVRSERLEIVTTKITNRRSKPFLVYLEQITVLKRYKKFRVDLFNMDHFKVMLQKTIFNDDF